MSRLDAKGQVRRAKDILDADKRGPLQGLRILLIPTA